MTVLSDDPIKFGTRLLLDLGIERHGSDECEGRCYESVTASKEKVAGTVCNNAFTRRAALISVVVVQKRRCVRGIYGIAISLRFDGAEG